MKHAALPLFYLACLYIIHDRLMSLQSGYFLLICTLVLIPSMVSIFYKFKKDKEEGKFTFSRQGVSILFIAGTMIFAVIQQFTL